MQLKHKGHTFQVETERDDHMRAPWEEHDGHGVVTGWQRRDFVDPPRGFWRLSTDRYHERLYNWRETMDIAKRDGWGLGNEDIAKLEKRLGREPSARDIRKEAVRRDFEYLRGWCNDEWQWLCIGVTLPGFPTEWLGGVDGASDDYIMECARELADEILHKADASKDLALMEVGG